MTFLVLITRKLRIAAVATAITALAAEVAWSQATVPGVVFVEGHQTITPNWAYLNRHVVLRERGAGGSTNVETEGEPDFRGGVELFDGSDLFLRGSSVQQGLDLNDESGVYLQGGESVDFVTVRDSASLNSPRINSTLWEIETLIAEDRAHLGLRFGRVGEMQLHDESTARIHETSIGALAVENEGEIAMDGGSLGGFSSEASTVLTLERTELTAGFSLGVGTGSRVEGTAQFSGPGAASFRFDGDGVFALETTDAQGEPSPIRMRVMKGHVRAETPLPDADIYMHGLFSELTSSAGSLVGTLTPARRPEGVPVNRPLNLLRLPGAEVRWQGDRLLGTDAAGAEINLQGASRDPTFRPAEHLIVSTSETALTDFRPLVYYNAENGHYYEAVFESLDWLQSRAAAEKLTYGGASGHLITITSAEEQAFLDEHFDVGPTWIGASDAGTEGEWRWVVGPEAGQVFWQGGLQGSALAYSNWVRDFAPNNNFRSENFGLWEPDFPGWDDVLGSNSRVAYLVEYEPVPGDVNGDGAADLADFAILKEYFGDYADRNHGDLNADLFVDLADFQLLKEGFGAAAPVPEPSGWALALLGGFAARLLRRRRPV